MEIYIARNKDGRLKMLPGRPRKHMLKNYCIPNKDTTWEDLEKLIEVDRGCFGMRKIGDHYRTYARLVWCYKFREDDGIPVPRIDYEDLLRYGIHWSCHYKCTGVTLPEGMYPELVWGSEPMKLTVESAGDYWDLAKAIILIMESSSENKEDLVKKLFGQAKVSPVNGK